MRYFHGFVLAALAVSVTGAAAQRADSAAQSAPSKLTSVLAALSQSVAQTASAPARAGAATPMSVDALGKPVQDAIHGGWMRMNAANEVQVYILMSEVTDATVGQLTAAGATIEIRDAAHRRVQARVPASLLQAVSQLAVVDAIRLPNYARRRTGAVTTEGHRPDCASA